MRALAAAVLAVLAFAPAAEAAPPNDNIENAVIVGALPFTHTVDTRFGNEFSDPFECGLPLAAGSVWYRFTPAATGPIQISAAGSSFLAKIQIYTGSPGALVPATGYCPGLGEGHKRVLTGGTTYYFMVKGAGDLTFTVSTIPPPANDDFNAATLIPGFPYTQNLGVFAATTAADDPTGTCGRNHTVWYRLATPKQRRFRVVADSDVHLSVFKGSRPALTNVGCITNGYTWFDFLAAGGTNYWIRLSTPETYYLEEYNFRAEMVPIDVTLGMTFSSRKIVYGQTIKVGVHLGPSFNFDETTNHEVWIDSWQRDGPDGIAAKGNVNANGDWTATLKPTANQSLSANWSGENGYQAAGTSLREVAVRTSLKLNMTGGKRQKNGLRVYKKGAAPRAVVQRRPFQRGFHVDFRLEIGKRSGYKRLSLKSFGVDRSGNVRISMRGLPSGTRFRLRAEVDANLWNLGNRTRWTYFQINR